MERKTIGSFIATLRKANGMTQKELAEKLNVSDKTISRWERDDGVPDLAVIPVLAEIFGVTCDELLRGERTPQSLREEEIVPESTVKGEKQRRRILAVGLSKYKTRTLIAIGISTVGLLAAMIGNLGFLRAYIGFLLGTIFYVIGIVCQAVFLNHAFLAVDEEEWKDEEVGKFKRTLIRWAEAAIGLAIMLFAFTLPLVVWIHDTYVGLSAESWFLYGGVFAGIAFLAVCIICHFLNVQLLERGVYSLGQKDENVYRKNSHLAQKCAIVTAFAVAVTAVVYSMVTVGGNAHALADGTEFYDYESFQEYMAKPDSRSYYDGETVMVAEPVSGEVTYYDEFGNEISEEEALTRELYDSEGNVVCRYVQRNENVCSVRYTDRDGNLFPITVVTYDDLQLGRGKLEFANTIFGFLYCLEIIAGIAIYFRKRI